MQRRYSGKALQSMIGHVVSLFSVQRCCIFMLQTLWRDADRLVNKVGELRRSGLAEKWTACSLAPVSYRESRTSALRLCQRRQRRRYALLESSVST